MSSSSVDQSLQTALREFQAALDVDQQKRLHEIKAVPDVDAVIKLINELDTQKTQKHRRSVATRISKILGSVQQFCSVVDTFVSSHPSTAALVWGSVRLTMLIASNFVSYFNELLHLFMKFSKLCPLFTAYEILYPHSTRLQISLCEFHASIIRCCKQALQVTQRAWFTNFFNSFSSSFGTEFEPYRLEVERCSEQVKLETCLAESQASEQDRQLQIIERKSASEGRASLSSGIAHLRKKTDRNIKFQVERSERDARKHRRRLLETLSSYNHFLAYKQASGKSAGDTAQWLTSTIEFKEWVHDNRYPVFWCSGKLGSGKTVLMAKVIAHIISGKSGSKVLTGFFFCQFDVATSLEAETILRSIIRQFLNDTTLPKDIEDCLQKITQDTSLGLIEVRSFLQSMLQKQVASSQKTYIFIDALDECEKNERDVVFDFLRVAIASSQSKLKVFLTARDSIGIEVKKLHFPLQHQYMGSPGALSSLNVFIKDSIDSKVADRELVVGDHAVVLEVQEALLGGAQGMFLWVVFQIDDICSQVSDYDIRKALRHLPKDLPETFNRALGKILVRSHSKIAQQVFRWTAVVKRPLSLDELREAIAIEPCQQGTNSERLVNDPGQISTWCENLIIVDEEEDIVQFAHQSVKDYLLTYPLESPVDVFHIESADADHEVGEICTTYLNFNDFKAQLIRRPEFEASKTAGGIAMAAMKQLSASKTVNKLVQSASSRIVHQGSANKLATTQHLINMDRFRHGSRIAAPGHPFLDYASKYWLLHTMNFDPSTSKSWELWARTLLDEHGLRQIPWTPEEFSDRAPKVLQWIGNERHYALLGFLNNSAAPMSAYNRSYFLEYVSSKGDSAQVDEIVKRGHFKPTDMAAGLAAAADRGHFDVVERLLAADADVNAVFKSNYGQARGTALQAAIKSGRLDLVEKLLAANADINAPAGKYSGRTALQAAAAGGHLDVVEKLLAANADVNAPAGEDYGRTALQAAAEGGHLDVVEKLLAANADVNAPAAEKYGRTALQAAAEGGYLDIVEKLLAANADVNAPAGEDYGQTALQAAVERDYLNIVEKLLAANADVNAPAGGEYGRTALQAAAEGGHLDIVERLLGANADVNVVDSYGNTALILAFQVRQEREDKTDYDKIVDRLKSAGAKV